MKTRLLKRWVIVLFLLAALPGLTAVMAQGQEPALPTLACNLHENNTHNIGLNDVLCGSTASSDEIDSYQFSMPHKGFILLLFEQVGFEWASVSNAAGTVVASSGWWDSFGPGCDYQREAHPFIFATLDPGQYTVRVGNEEDMFGAYTLSLIKPVLLSAAAAGLASGGDVAGIHFDARDVLAYAQLNTGEKFWTKLFNASTAGITKNVTNIAASNGERMFLTLANNQTFPGAGTVTPWDIVIFDGGVMDWQNSGCGGFGPATTWGTVTMGLDGSAHQLTTAAEKLDAIDGWTNGYDRCYGFPVSTAGVASVTGWLGTMKQDDEDVFCKVENNGWQPYDWFFDVKGANNAPASEPSPGRVPGLPAEDVVAMAYDDVNDKIYLVIQGTGKIHGHTVTQKDIFALNYPSYSWSGIVWHGPDHGWNYNIDAIELNGW